MGSTKVMLCMALVVVVATIVSADTGKYSTCCVKVSTAKPKVHLEDFILQHEDFPCVKAVIFTTKGGDFFCSKPDLNWVKKKVKEIGLRKQELQSSGANA